MLQSIYSSEISISKNSQEISSVIMTDEIILNTDVYEVLEIDPIDQKQLALADYSGRVCQDHF